MEQQPIPQKYIAAAGECHQKGCNCAESVLHAFRDLLPLSDDTMRIATCFGGGGAGQFGFCGAYSGAVIVLSLLSGRRGPEESRETAYTYSKEFNERFTAHFGANSCKALQIYEYGSAEQKSNCRKITATAAGMMAEFLAEKHLLPSEPRGSRRES
jgi:C_GCAxxG_C_C family probable redox protein